MTTLGTEVRDSLPHEVYNRFGIEVDHFIGQPVTHPMRMDWRRPSGRSDGTGRPHDLVAGGNKGWDDVSTEKSRCPGYQDSHGDLVSSSPKPASRSEITRGSAGHATLIAGSS